MNVGITIVTPAVTQDLTILATVKTELGIAVGDTSHDAALALYITQSSATIAAYCNRVFGQETVSERFRFGGSYGCTSTLFLSRIPVTTIASITENGTALTVDVDYEIDLASGAVTRLSSNCPLGWAVTGTTVIQYTGGYALLDGLPQDIERACILLVSGGYNTQGRDPALRSLTIPDVVSEVYFDPTATTGSGIASIDIRSMLAPYRRMMV